MGFRESINALCIKLDVESHPMSEWICSDSAGSDFIAFFRKELPEFEKERICIQKRPFNEDHVSFGSQSRWLHSKGKW